MNMPLVMVLSYLCPLVDHSAHWHQESQVYQEDLALPEDPGGLCSPALRAGLVLFGLTLMNGAGSGSRLNYSETNDLQEERKEGKYFIKKYLHTTFNKNTIYL